MAKKHLTQRQIVMLYMTGESGIKPLDRIIVLLSEFPEQNAPLALAQELALSFEPRTNEWILS